MLREGISNWICSKWDFGERPSEGKRIRLRPDKGGGDHKGRQGGLSHRGTRRTEGREVDEGQASLPPTHSVVGSRTKERARMEELAGAGDDPAGWLVLGCCGKHESHQSTGF